MNTARMGTGIVGGHSTAHAFSKAQVVSGAAAASVFLLFVFAATQTANPLAHLVGMSPIAWIAIEGVWRLFR
jgi:hypothetical protein